MAVLKLTVHPRGLSPDMAAKAWFLRVKQHYAWSAIAQEVVNVQGEAPSLRCLRLAVARMSKAPRAMPKCKYANCGRRWGSDGGKYKLLPAVEQKVVDLKPQKISPQIEIYWWDICWWESGYKS